jgi:hypothetical protein
MSFPAPAFDYFNTERAFRFGRRWKELKISQIFYLFSVKIHVQNARYTTGIYRQKWGKK